MLRARERNHTQPIKRLSQFQIRQLNLLVNVPHFTRGAQYEAPTEVVHNCTFSNGTDDFDLNNEEARRGSDHGNFLHEWSAYGDEFTLEGEAWPTILTTRSGTGIQGVYSEAMLSKSLQYTVNAC
jgi:hypothetical protein